MFKQSDFEVKHVNTSGNWLVLFRNWRIHPFLGESGKSVAPAQLMDFNLFKISLGNPGKQSRKAILWDAYRLLQ
jgi:hypothetical protein